ncbi:MAG: group II intron reverse transcriptase/maturase [Euryarchaeota archaeon]|nr:group II intron reverse transcriptase/maturase [Euryarchaeota archaeon]
MKLYRESSSKKEKPLKHLKKLLVKEETLRTAWKNLNRDTNSVGVDCLSIRQVKESGVDDFLKAVQKELKTNRYRADKIRRIDIPKENGTQRHIGIMTVKDRLVQGAMKLILEPIFEADFEDSSFGFRPSRSTKLASLEVYKWLETGLNHVVKGDIKNCFDSIPHKQIMDCLKVRIGDKYLLSIIEAWLKAGVVEADSVYYPEKGVPQGGIISPLLVNIYLSQMDREWRRNVFDGHAGRSEERLVRYADDFVVLGKKWVDFARIEAVLADLGLEINREKTYTSNVKKGFEFLGYTFREVSSKEGLEGKIRLLPSGSSVRRVIEAVEKATEFDPSSPRPLEYVLEDIQKVVRPWMCYYHHTEYLDGLEEIQRYFNVQLREYTRKYREIELFRMQEKRQISKAF